MTVSIEDSSGDVVTTDNSTVTVAIASGPAGAALNGTLSVAAVNGVATFSDLSLTQLGAYTLSATDSTLASAASASFTMSAGLPGYTVFNLASFQSSGDSMPSGGIVMDEAGNLFGTTRLGGPTDDGTIYELAQGSPTVTTLASFNLADGSQPSSGLTIDAAGNLYGTTGFGGANGSGVVFELARAGNTVTVLASFASTDGNVHSGLTVDAAGNLFGTSELGGAQSIGSVFEVASGSGLITTRASFDGTNGSQPIGGLVSDPAGNLFGTTSTGGSNGAGTIFELPATANTITTLASFDAASNGANPSGRLVIDTAGDLFGTTSSGGANNVGTLFELSGGTSNITTLASFGGANGVDPTDLIIGEEGSLYGATASGGVNNQGVVFELPKGRGVITSLTNFNGIDGAAPLPQLAIDSSDNVFGAAAGLGPGGQSDVFELSPTGIGDPDVTFDASGISSLSVGLNSTAGMVLQADGKSVVAGPAGAAGAQVFSVIRYNSDGSLDTTFGNNGVAQTSFGGDDVPAAVTLLSNGDILVAGTSTTIIGGQTAGSQFAVAEYTPTGMPDPTFGNGTGKVLTSFSPAAGVLSNDLAHAIAVGRDGTIFVGGSSDASGQGQEFAIAAYTPAGSPATGFGADGKLLLPLSAGNASIAALAIDGRGSATDLIAAGSVSDPSSGVSSVALAALHLPAGTLDRRFGSKGTVITRVGTVDDAASSMAIDRQNRIVLGGYSATGSVAAGTLSSDFLLLRYTAAGKLDRSFGRRGIVLTPFTGQTAAITRVLIGADGRILASGKATASLANLDVSQLELAVARYVSNGALDTSFNDTGTAVYQLSSTRIAAVTTTAQIARAPVNLQDHLVAPAEATSGLMQSFQQLVASAQGVVAVTSGGDLLDVGNSAGNTVEAAIVAMGVDLSVALAAHLPGSVIAGARGSAAVTITEGGSALASGVFVLQLSVSTDAPSAAPVALQSFSEKLSLKENKSRLVHLNFRYPSSLPEGNYHLVATVNTGATRDLNVINNTSATASTILIAPAFVQLAGRALTAPTFNDSKPAVVSFTVTNTGNSSAVTPSSVQFLASADGTLPAGVPLETTPVRFNLRPSATRVFKVKVSLPATLPTGVYFLLALLDPANVFNDPNAASNFILSGNTFHVG